MPSVAVNVGRLLILIGVAGYAYGFFGGRASITAMIPAFFGIAFLIIGRLALAKEGLSKHLMHLGVVLALLGFVLPAGRMLMKIKELSFTAAYLSQASMALICLVFIVLAVRSFIMARSA